ncbi:MAG: hypothetical protein B6243_13075 [Anaerolineaceae bacterium 4572_5.2]|nr:MAG: hypothetical protein B6243_13075 [Anaerolineaceae bacterium 4572_5.2]
MENNEKFEFLRNIYIFHSLRDSELEEIAAQFEAKEYPRSATATSRGGVVLRLEKSSFKELLENHSPVKDVIEYLSSSYALAHKKNFSWLGEDEVVRFIDQRHIAVLFRRLLLPILTILAAGLVVFFGVIQGGISVSAYVVASISLGIAVLWSLWIFVDWGNDYYIVTSNRIVWLEKVVWLYDQRKEAPHQTILSINTRSNQIQRILHYADVIVRTYTGEIAMNDAAHPEYLAGLATTYWHLAEERLEEERIAGITTTIRERLGFEEKVPETENEPNNDDQGDTSDEQSGFILPQWLGNLLKTRYEVEGVITYRKHIFILFKQTWFFLLMFIILISLFIIFFSLSSAFLGRVLLFTIGAGILFVFGNLWYRYMDWKNDLFQITDKEITDVDKKPFGEATKRSAPLENILSLDYKRANIIQRIFNFGTVAINVGNSQLDFENVARPDAVQTELFEHYYAALRRKKEKEAQRYRDDVVEFLEIYHKENKRYERSQAEAEDIETPAAS